MNPPEQSSDGLRYPLTRDLQRGDLVYVEDLMGDGIWRLYTRAEATQAERYGRITEVCDMACVGENLYDIFTNLGTVRGARGDWTAVAK